MSPSVCSLRRNNCLAVSASFPLMLSELISDAPCVMLVRHSHARSRPKRCPDHFVRHIGRIVDVAVKKDCDTV